MLAAWFDNIGIKIFYKVNFECFTNIQYSIDNRQNA